MLRSIGALVLLPALLQCRQSSPAPQPTVEARPRSAIRISFRLDPRVSGPTYGGERWLSPPTYASAAQPGNEATVEARVHGVDASGRSIRIRPAWTAADPGMIVVSPVAPGQLDHVQIRVKHPGESKLKVASLGTSRELLVKARSLGGKAIQVEIAQ